MQKEYTDLAQRYKSLEEKAKANQSFGKKIAKGVPGADKLFSEGAEGSEDLGVDIIMRRDLEGLPRKYWLQTNEDPATPAPAVQPHLQGPEKIENQLNPPHAKTRTTFYDQEDKHLLQTGLENTSMMTTGVQMNLMVKSENKVKAAVLESPIQAS